MPKLFSRQRLACQPSPSLGQANAVVPIINEKPSMLDSVLYSHMHPRTADGLPPAKWLADLDRIERSVARINTPVGFASEAYTLRQHIDFVRHAVMVRTNLPPVA